MLSIYRLLQFEQESEHNLKKKKQYGKVSIFNAGGDLSARWYVYYTFRNPENGHLERQPNIYFNINDYDTLRDRNKAAKLVKESVEAILANGFNPYEKETRRELKLPPQEPININSAKTITEAIDFALDIAKKLQAESAYPDFKSRVTQFKVWLVNRKKAKAKMSEVQSIDAVNFLNEVLQRTSARNRNNTRVAISSLYKILVNNEIVKENVIEKIDVFNSRPTKNKTFTTDQEEKILELLEEKDPVLHLFVKFISINLLRPIEVCRRTVGDIHLRDRVLKVKAKNQPVKTKIIPELLLKDLPDLSNCNTTDFLFTPDGIGQWDAKEVNRRNFFSDRFKKIKDAIGLGTEYGLYSFRHTYITKLYRELKKEYTPFETKSRLMLITGHSTMDALEKYLRDIDAELPEDYSYLIK